MSQQINLYNAAFRPKRQLLTAKLLAISTGVLLVVLVAAAGFSKQQATASMTNAAAAQATMKAAQARLDKARSDSAARKPSPALQAEVDRMQALLAMRDEVLVAVGKGVGDPATGSGGSFGDYLRGLARQSQEGLWLTRFGVDAGGANMSLGGRTIDKALLPGYVRRLNSEKVFAGKSFNGLSMDFKEGAPAAAAPVVVVGADGRALAAPAALPAKASSYLEFQLVAVATAATSGGAAEKKP